MAVSAYTYVRFGDYSSYTFKVGSGVHWWTGSGGVHTFGPTRLSFWWAALPGRMPYYMRSWTTISWSLIESIDGLEFV